MNNNITVYTFFDLVLSGEMGALDIDNYIQQKTDNYDYKKLKSLLSDIEYCMFCEKEEKISEYNNIDIEKALKDLQSKNKEIPYKEIPEIKGKDGKVMKASKILDLEKIFFPFDFFTIYQLLNKIKSLIKEQEVLTVKQTETKTDILKVPQIALIHVYEGIQITRENAGKIAAKYGYTSKTSGEGLFQDYTKYISTANRKGKPTDYTLKKLNNKIELFESVVNHLSNNNKQRAIDEINTLKTLLENEYQ